MDPVLSAESIGKALDVLKRRAEALDLLQNLRGVLPHQARCHRREAFCTSSLHQARCHRRQAFCTSSLLYHR